jgi:hypothetical protein
MAQLNRTGTDQERRQTTRYRTFATPFGKTTPCAKETAEPMRGGRSGPRQLPVAFEDDWIDAVLKDRSVLRHFSQRVDTTKPPMELRYLRDVADDHGLDWEYTEKVLSSRDIDDWMRKGW